MRLIIAVLACLWLNYASAQESDPIVMTIDGHEILRSEFEHIYNRDMGSRQESDVESYAWLFVERKLKAWQGVSLGLDTTRNFRSELEAYNGCLLRSLLSDDGAGEQMARYRYEKRINRDGQGLVRVSQIYRRLPQNVTNRAMQRCEELMDSLYDVLQQSPAVFDSLVELYSDDKETKDLVLLQSTEEFEGVVSGLNEGDISKPFYTPGGMHIVKLLLRNEVPTYEAVKDSLKTSLVHRSAASIVERLKRECGFKEESKAVAALVKGSDADARLFSIAGRAYTTAGFNRFAEAYPRERSAQYEAFVAKSLMDYESDHIDELHPELNLLRTEHHDDMLVAEMEKLKVIDPASDESNLEAYFNENRSNYKWEPYKYLGVVVKCKNEKTGRRIKKTMKKVPYEQWPDSIASQYTAADGTATAKAEYALFSQGDNDVVDFMVYGSGTVNTSDGYPYAYVYGKKQKEPDSYREVSEAVKTDYQKHLEQAWTKQLRHESRVEIKQEVLKTVNNH